MTVAQRKWAAFGAIVITAGLLTACTGTTSDSPNGNGDGGNTPSNSLSCNWDAPAVTVETAADPAVQEGVLSEIIVGEWQRIGFDIGAGFQAYGTAADGTTVDDGERDYRFVFSAEGEFVDCQSTPTSDRDETRGDYTVEETAITLADDGKYTAVSWNADLMTWKSSTSGATVYLQRR